MGGDFTEFEKKRNTDHPPPLRWAHLKNLKLQLTDEKMSSRTTPLIVQNGKGKTNTFKIFGLISSSSLQQLCVFKQKLIRRHIRICWQRRASDDG